MFGRRVLSPTNWKGWLVYLVWFGAPVTTFVWLMPWLKERGINGDWAFLPVGALALWAFAMMLRHLD